MPQRTSAVFSGVAFLLTFGCLRADYPTIRTPQALIDASPCDVLPETQPHLGTLAHDSGYPRLVDGSLRYGKDLGRPPFAAPGPEVARAFTGDTILENEVHDCQRLAEAGAFGPLVAVLPIDAAMAAPESDIAQGMAVATIYNWGDLDGKPLEYGPLSIGHRWNCLWLREIGGEWKGAITSGSTTACYRRPVPPDQAFDLAVQRAKHEDGHEMPPTARWGYDVAKDVHYVGIKCGDTWCSVGPAGLWQQPDVTLTGPARLSIPGYYDEQHLAVPTPDLKGIVPGPPSRIVPTQAFLDAVQRQAQAGPGVDVLGPLFATGLDVAELHIQGTVPAVYAARYGSGAGPFTIRLTVPQGGSVPAPPSAQYLDGGGNPHSAKQVVHVAHTAHASVGSVRWRWHDTPGSESSWSACGSRGRDCCDTN